MILILLSLLNLIIFFKISKLSKFFNIYDKPDNKLKLHKKNTNYRWYNFGIKF